jgi:transcriptional regulator with XRE-family HTH domain
MTQAKAAKAAGVTQPTYQRWEIGQVEVPYDKLKKLAKAFETTEAELRGDPIRVSIYDSEAKPEHNYYGEVAVHFRGGGEPILLSISDAACDKLHSEMQEFNRTYVTVESLANQTVIIRRDAISDLYFSSEAYDDYGPEHRNDDGSYNREGYKNHIEWQIADPHTWEILECLAYDGVGPEDFEEADIKRVEKLIRISDEEYAQLVADGHIKAEDLESEKAKNEKQASQLFEAATDIVYQLSNGGVLRKFNAYSGDDEKLYNAVYQFIEYEFSDDEIMPEMIRFALEGSHRMIFINRLAFDYMSLPTHQLKRGWLEAQEEMIDSFDPDVQEAAKLAVANDARPAGKKKPATKKSTKLKLVPRQPKA